MSPEQIEPDGSPERLLNGRTWAVRGSVRDTAFDRLFLRTAPLAGRLQRHAPRRVRQPERRRPFPDLPLPARNAPRQQPARPRRPAARTSIPCHWSLIHGDLHGRNVLVGPQGQPFYVDFARTGYGPTLFDFIKFEAYLWHENFADWPTGPSPVGLAEAIELLDDLASADPARHFPSPYAQSGAARPSRLGRAVPPVRRDDPLGGAALCAGRWRRGLLRAARACSWR